ncbi:MAG TPA: hypothetical protein VIN59_09065 [Alphaproteobacteria bacterium]
MLAEDPQWVTEETYDVNCYAYALNEKFAGSAKPGLLRLQDNYRTLKQESMTATAIERRLRHDGLERILEHSVSAEGKHIIAAFTSSTRQDFHFLRLNRDNIWTHKFRSGLRLRDNQDKIITDPKAAALGIYDVFVGYFQIPDQGISFVPRKIFAGGIRLF